ncbi:MAG: plastocyanin/azurin family copper-binding protein [Ktedonobacterales bacterium]
MKKFGLFLVPLALILAFSFAACGKTPGTGSSSGPSCATSQTIDLVATNFATSCQTVSANQTVTFNDPTGTGGIHIICTGQNATCSNDSTAPKDLQGSGFQITPGQTHQVTFTKPGTYKLACTVHPNMNMTLTVK